jgi:hypothetical protein
MRFFHHLCAALLAASATSLAATPNESANLKLAIDTASHCTTLLDKRGGVAWDLGVVPNAALSKDGRSVVIHRTVGSNEPIKLLDGALGITTGEQGCALVPAREGLLIPADSDVEFSRSFSTSGYEGCHMNMMGFVRRGAALLMTWDDAYIRPDW